VARELGKRWLLQVCYISLLQSLLCTWNLDRRSTDCKKADVSIDVPVCWKIIHSLSYMYTVPLTIVPPVRMTGSWDCAGFLFREHLLIFIAPSPPSMVFSTCCGLHSLLVLLYTSAILQSCLMCVAFHPEQPAVVAGGTFSGEYCLPFSPSFLPSKVLPPFKSPSYMSYSLCLSPTSLPFLCELFRTPPPLYVLSPPYQLK